MKIIHTNLFSDTAYDVLYGVMYRLGNQRAGKSERCANVSSVERDLNNEVIIKIDDSSWYYTRSAYRKFDNNNEPFTDQVFDFYANYLKNAIVKPVLGAIWKRDNTEKKIHMYMTFREDSKKSFTVQELYYIYDFLKHRKNLDHRYPADIIKKINGEEFNPILTEQNRMIQEELAKLEKERADAHTKRRQEYDAEYRALNKQLADKDNERKDAIEAEFQKKKDAILKDFNELKALAA